MASWWFAVGCAASVLTSILVTLALRRPLRGLLVEVCCGEDRGLFWWRITAALLLLGGSVASLLVPAQAEAVVRFTWQQRLTTAWLATTLMVIIGAIEFFAWKRRRSDESARVRSAG